MWQAILPALLAASPRPATDCAEDPAALARQAENLVAGGTPTPEDLAEARDFVRRARLASPSLALALRGADLAAAAGDTDDEARLLEIAAKEAPELLSPAERLVLARQAEARGDRRGAILQYGHVLAALQRRARVGRGLDRREHPAARRRGRGPKAPGSPRIRAAVRGRPPRFRRRQDGPPARGERARAGGVPEGAPPLAGILRGRARARERRGTERPHRGSGGGLPDGPRGGAGRLRGPRRPLESSLERARPPGEGGVARAARPCRRAPAGPSAASARGGEPVGGLGRPGARPRAARRVVGARFARGKSGVHLLPRAPARAPGTVLGSRARRPRIGSRVSRSGSVPPRTGLRGPVRPRATGTRPNPSSQRPSASIPVSCRPSSCVPRCASGGRTWRAPRRSSSAPSPSTRRAQPRGSGWPSFWPARPAAGATPRSPGSMRTRPALARRFSRSVESRRVRGVRRAP